MDLVTPKAGAKHDLLFNKLAFNSPATSDGGWGLYYRAFTVVIVYHIVIF